ncbi:MAG: hypothetical protein AB1630_11630 [bacterium]
MMKNISKILNKNQLETLEIIKEFRNLGTLGGGTGLMLQLPYRYSYDFDIFLQKVISKKFLYKLKQYFK